MFLSACQCARHAISGVVTRKVVQSDRFGDAVVRLRPASLAITIKLYNDCNLYDSAEKIIDYNNFNLTPPDDNLNVYGSSVYLSASLRKPWYPQLASSASSSLYFLRPPV